MYISPVNVNFKGQKPVKSNFIGKAIDKAAQKAEEKYKSPNDVYTMNNFDVHAAFWSEIAKGVADAAKKVVNSFKKSDNE